MQMMSTALGVISVSTSSMVRWQTDHPEKNPGNLSLLSRETSLDGKWTGNCSFFFLSGPLPRKKLNVSSSPHGFPVRLFLLQRIENRFYELLIPVLISGIWELLSSSFNVGAKCAITHVLQTSFLSEWQKRESWPKADVAFFVQKNKCEFHLFFLLWHLLERTKYF